jgi:hypothetical protein
MKTILILSALMMVALLSQASKTIHGDSNSLLKEYTLTQVSDNLYELTYSNANSTFTIEVCPSSKECCYLVRGENLEVMYLCNKLGLGLRKMPEKQQKLAQSKYHDLIDAETFRRQSQIVAKKKSTADALALIACFLPHTVKPEMQAATFDINTIESQPMAKTALQ